MGKPWRRRNRPAPAGTTIVTSPSRRSDGTWRWSMWTCEMSTTSTSRTASRSTVWCRRRWARRIVSVGSVRNRTPPISTSAVAWPTHVRSTRSLAPPTSSERTGSGQQRPAWPGNATTVERAKHGRTARPAWPGNATTVERAKHGRTAACVAGERNDGRACETRSYRGLRGRGTQRRSSVRNTVDRGLRGRGTQ